MVTVPVLVAVPKIVEPAVPVSVPKSKESFWTTSSLVLDFRGEYL